jgi:hypothetical protein
LAEQFAYLTRGVRAGIVITLITTATLVYLVFFAAKFHFALTMGAIVAFQLSFIWTCAELIDGPDEELPPEDDEPPDGNYSY